MDIFSCVWWAAPKQQVRYLKILGLCEFSAGLGVWVETAGYGQGRGFAGGSWGGWLLVLEESGRGFAYLEVLGTGKGKGEGRFAVVVNLIGVETGDGIKRGMIT